MNDAKTQVSAHGGFGPLWSHSGKELFYLNGTFEMVAATARAGTTFAIAGEKTLFPTASGFYRALNYRQYDISPDDKRFIMMRVAPGLGGSATAELILIENWLSEVKAKVGK